MASESDFSQGKVNKVDSPLIDQQTEFNIDIDKELQIAYFIDEMCTRYVIVYCGDITEVIPITTDCRFIDDMVSDFIDRYFAACDEEQEAPEDP